MHLCITYFLKCKCWNPWQNVFGKTLLLFYIVNISVISCSLLCVSVFPVLSHFILISAQILPPWVLFQNFEKNRHWMVIFGLRYTLSLPFSVYAPIFRVVGFQKQSLFVEFICSRRKACNLIRIIFFWLVIDEIK